MKWGELVCWVREDANLRQALRSKESDMKQRDGVPISDDPTRVLRARSTPLARIKRRTC